jgi:hypothetical protein
MSPLRVTIDPIAKQMAKFHGVFDRAYFNHRLKGPPADAHGRQPRCRCVAEPEGRMRVPSPST